MFDGRGWRLGRNARNRTPLRRQGQFVSSTEWTGVVIWACTISKPHRCWFTLLCFRSPKSLCLSVCLSVCLSLSLSLSFIFSFAELQTMRIVSSAVVVITDHSSSIIWLFKYTLYMNLLLENLKMPAGIKSCCSTAVRNFVRLQIRISN